MTLTEPVQMQLIITFGSIIAAIVAAAGIVIVAMLNRTRQHAKVAADQTQNSHKSNLRDDLDLKFEGLEGLVKALARDVGGMKSDMRGIRAEALVDRQTARDDREHIRTLEDTLTPAQMQRLRDNNKEHHD